MHTILIFNDVLSFAELCNFISISALPPAAEGVLHRDWLVSHALCLGLVVWWMLNAEHCWTMIIWLTMTNSWTSTARSRFELRSSALETTASWSFWETLGQNKDEPKTKESKERPECEDMRICVTDVQHIGPFYWRWLDDQGEPAALPDRFLAILCCCFGAPSGAPVPGPKPGAQGC